MSDAPYTLDDALATRMRLVLRISRGILLLACVVSLGIDLLTGAPKAALILRALEFTGTFLLIEIGLRVQGLRGRYGSVILALGWFGVTDGYLNAQTLQPGAASLGAALVLVGLGMFPLPLQRALLGGAVTTTAAVLGLWLGGLHEPGALLMPATVAGVGVGLAYIQYLGELQSWRLREEALRTSEARREAEAARSRFLARMSHELRTPLNGILGMVSAARTHPLLPAQQEALSSASQSGALMLAMIDDVLAFAAGEREGVTLVPEAVDVVTLLRRCLADSDRAEGDPLPLLEVRSPPPEALLLDPRRLQQIVQKLVGNARRFSPPGGEIRVRLSWSEAPSILSLEVRDSGPGLPADPTHLFHPFEQADTSPTRRHDGLGLGLALVQQIVDAMGGCISARSHPRGGACFAVEIPAVPAGTPLALEHFSAEGRVLIVEDNAINRAVLRHIIEPWGVTVDEAEDGARGLEQMRAHGYPLVFMDHHMPVMDGLEATRKARAEGFSGAIVAVTASTLPADREASIAAGMNAHLHKPIYPEQIARLLATHLLPDRCAAPT